MNHVFEWCSFTECDLCALCGTAKHSDGTYMKKGQSYTEAPPCGNNEAQATPVKKGL